MPIPGSRPGKMKGLKGDLFLQQWAPASSKETRLIPDDVLTAIDYDNPIYEQQLCYFNRKIRKHQEKIYSQPIK